jgi:hypothetical protein
LRKYILKSMGTKRYIFIGVEEKCPLQLVRPAGDQNTTPLQAGPETLEGQVVPYASTIIGPEYCHWDIRCVFAHPDTAFQGNGSCP